MGRIIPYIMENKKMFQTTNQYVYIYTTQYIGNYNNPRTGNPFSVHFAPDKSKVQWVFSIVAHLRKSHGPPYSPTLYSIIYTVKKATGTIRARWQRSMTLLHRLPYSTLMKTSLQPVLFVSGTHFFNPRVLVYKTTVTSMRFAPLRHNTW